MGIFRETLVGTLVVTHGVRLKTPIAHLKTHIVHPRTPIAHPRNNNIDVNTISEMIVTVDVEIPAGRETTVEDANKEIRIIRKKTDTMEMTTVLIASVIPLNTLTKIPLNNPPQERR